MTEWDNFWTLIEDARNQGYELVCAWCGRPVERGEADHEPDCPWHDEEEDAA